MTATSLCVTIVVKLEETIRQSFLPISELSVNACLKQKHDDKQKDAKRAHFGSSTGKTPTSKQSARFFG
jgi:hypothetical protein